MSSGCLHLVGRFSVQVLPNGVVMHGGSHGHKQVPDGVGKRDDTVTFEEDNPQTVKDAPCQQLIQARLLRHRQDDEGRKESHHSVADELHQFVPLVKEEDVCGAEGCHDPDQPAHVTGPGSQFPKIQPGGVGGSDKEVDDHPVTHVEAVLHRPEVAFLPGHGVEQGGDDEEGAEAGSVKPGRHPLPWALGAAVKHGAAQEARDYPQRVCGAVGSMLVLCGLVSLMGRNTAVHKP